MYMAIYRPVVYMYTYLIYIYIQYGIQLRQTRDVAESLLRLIVDEKAMFRNHKDTHLPACHFTCGRGCCCCA